MTQKKEREREKNTELLMRMCHGSTHFICPCASLRVVLILASANKHVEIIQLRLGLAYIGRLCQFMVRESWKRLAENFYSQQLGNDYKLWFTEVSRRFSI